MSIRIDQTACIGCQACTKVCPGSLIQMDAHNRAEIVYEKDCWGCASCVKACNSLAIGYYIGADMDGRGSIMKITQDGDFSHWIIEDTNGNSQTITVNAKDANRY